MHIPSEARLALYIVGLYGSFIYWGYLQEKLTSTKYACGNALCEWNFPFALNFFMATAGYVTSFAIEICLRIKGPDVAFHRFWKAALTCCMASPVGYASLSYITFPMMILTKSCKPVPVMVIGSIFYARKYPWYKWASVALVCGGIVLFSSAKKSGAGSGTSSDLSMLAFGICLVLINLTLDGYTNNEQDEIFKEEKSTSLQMMKFTNLWQVIFIVVYLMASHFIVAGAFPGVQSELSNAVLVFSQADAVRLDIFLFCICASIGQVLIFAVMQEFGSLVWITISITRKLFTILVSIFTFNHSVKPLQWIGIASVFSGLVLESAMNYSKKTDKHIADLKKKAE